MAYAAVTSLMETLSLANENLGLLQRIPEFANDVAAAMKDLKAQMREMELDEAASSSKTGNDDGEAEMRVAAAMKDLRAQMREMELDEAKSCSKGWTKQSLLRLKACLPRRLHGIFNNPKKKKLTTASEKLLLQQPAQSSSSLNERIINARERVILISHLNLEVDKVREKVVSLHEDLSFLQERLAKSEILVYDNVWIKDLLAEMRDVSFKAQKRIEMELIKSANLLQQLPESSSSLKERVANALDSMLLMSSQLREVVKVTQKTVSLHKNLSSLQESLVKSEIAGYDNAWMKRLEAEMRDVSFKAEERIEMELTTIYLAKDSLQSSRIEVCSLLRLHGIFKEALEQTDCLKKKLIRINKLTKGSPHNERITDASLLGQRRGGGGLSQPDLQHNNITVSKFSKKASKFDDSRMVGCHNVFMTILDQLTRHSTKSRQVVSIVGMGGIGKTTLAHKVYEDPSVTSHFYMRAWVTVSQEYNVEQMLRCLIGCVIAASRDEQLHGQSTDQYQLADRLYKYLKGQRYLIVIDDIWSTTAWDSVQRYFPDDDNGSRILLTSRLREVAEYARSGNSPLNMPFLDADESWNLYCKVFGKTEFLSVFEQIGRDIVKKCEGLPLAITIVASLLSKTEEVEEKWKIVAAKSVIGDSNDACSRILYLSYNQLPHHLKACFLYFGVFQEDYEIPVKKLVRLWAAEGFLSTVKHVNMEKVAMECLQDLVDRSLVIVSKQSYNGEMKRIRIHDLLRDLCLREARLENLLNVIGVHKPCRWTSHTSRSFNNGDECFHNSRSFHFTNLYYFWKADVKRLFSQLKLLRVLNMEGVSSNGDKVLNVLATLVHLRYLALSTDGTFDVKLFEHMNMQSFIVSGDGVKLDSYEVSGIWKMPLLRNFCIGGIFSLETPSVIYRNLENISWLNFKLCTKDLFTRIPNLKKLGIDGSYWHCNIDFLDHFVHLGQLEKLSIRSWVKFPSSQCNIPLPWATSLPNLKKLSFLKSNLQWSELSPISMLPNLEVLKLIDTCEGEEWETSDEGFHRLKRLVIEKTNLRSWKAVGDHFPMLECLEISHCYFLEKIPCDFADITTLALIQLSYSNDSLLTSAKWIQDEQKKYGNDTLLVRSKNIGGLISFYPSDISLTI